MIRRTFLCCTLAASLGGIAVAAQQPIPDRPNEHHPGEVLVEYNRFSDVTVARLRFMEIDKGFSLYASYENKGERLTKPNSALIGLLSRSSDWQFLRCQSVALLVDGQRVTDLQSKYDGRVASGGGGVTEIFQVYVDIETLLKMATANTIEWQVCTTEFALEPQHITALRDLASRMKAN